jgi:pimeloyl-ACP methyl ester carboxylesterase
MRWFIAALFAVFVLSHGAAWACEGSRVDVGGYGLWMRVAGSGPVTVVFESGNGADSSDWSAVEPAVRGLGVRTVLYDRAGLGQSEPAPGPYSIDDDVAALERALAVCGVDGPIIIVAHSYGGFIAQLLAASDSDVAGLVLVDAAVPGYFTDEVAQGVVREYSPQFPALEQARPDLARVLIPIVRAYPETARVVRSATLPASTPVIDITAERSWVSTPEAHEMWRRAHAMFVAESSAREAVFAAGSGHNVMRDQPNVVIDAITRMIGRVTGG